MQTPHPHRPTRRPLRVVVTGAECTGKTTLARRLAERFGAPVVPEFVRGYVVEVGRELTFGDVEPIARGLLETEDAALAAAGAGSLVILDTDILSTAIYSQFYYGDCPAWIEEEAVARAPDLYLLLDTDVPWTPEPRLRSTESARAAQSRLFRERVLASGVQVVEVRGNWEERRRIAEEAIERLLAAQ